VINKLLAHNYNDNRIIIKLSDLKNKLAHAGYTGQIQNHWLDFEDIYRKQGWRVRCDVPGFNESYETYWEFYPSQCWEESEV
jgi:ASC-1-like (ASCH) protein